MTKKTKKKRRSVVKEWVLAASEGKCEMCDWTPFVRANGVPYLEVHHVVPLAYGGTDVVTNTIAVCPNCHKEMHFGERKNELLEIAYERVPRLSRLQISGSFYKAEGIPVTPSEGNSDSHISNLSDSIVEFLSKNGELTTTQLWKRFRSVDKKTRKYAISSLIERGLVAETVQETSGRPRKTYRSTTV